MDFATLIQRLGRGDFEAFKQRILSRIIIPVKANIQRKTRVRTGNLRRSWTHEVEGTAERGVIATTVVYAAFQRNDPIAEGIALTSQTLGQQLEDLGNDYFEDVAR